MVKKRQRKTSQLCLFTPMSSQILTVDIKYAMKNQLLSTIWCRSIIVSNTKYKVTFIRRQIIFHSDILSFREDIVPSTIQTAHVTILKSILSLFWYSTRKLKLMFLIFAFLFSTFEMIYIMNSLWSYLRCQRQT